MLDRETLREDLIIRKVDAKRVDNSRSFYKLLHYDTEESFWWAQHLATRQRVAIHESEFAGYELVGDRVRCDVDLSPLVGKDVTVTTQWGKFSGTVSEVRYTSISHRDTTLYVPRAIVVEGEETEMFNVVKLDVH